MLIPPKRVVGEQERTRERDSEFQNKSKQTIARKNSECVMYY